MKVRAFVMAALLGLLLPVASFGADFTVTTENPQLTLTDLSSAVTQVEFEARYAEAEVDLAGASWTPLATFSVEGDWMQGRAQLQSGLGVTLYFCEVQYRLHYGAEIMEWCAGGVTRVDLRPRCGTFTMSD